MLNRYLSYYSPGLQFVVLCALLSVSMLVGAQIFELLTLKWTGYSMAEIGEMKETGTVLADQLKVINVLSLTAILLVPAILFAYLAYPEPTEYLGLHFRVKPYYWLWAITLILISLPFTSLLEEWSKLIPAIGNSKELDQEYEKAITAMLHGNTLHDLFTNILFVCIAPALIEEIFFRACLQKVLINWMRRMPFVAILIVAAVFSAFHGQLSGFFPRMFLGVLLGLTYYFTGSIWTTILMHTINNLLTVMIIYLNNTGRIHIDLTKLPDMNLMLGIGSGIAVLGFTYYFYKNRRPFILHEVAKEETEPSLF